MTKSELLRLVNKEWQQLVGTVSSLTEELAEKPGLVGDWSVKDLMGHISFWENVAADRLEKILTGKRIQFIDDEDVPRINKEEVERMRSEPLSSIQRNLQLVHTELVRAIDRFPEEKFRSNDQNLTEWIAESTYQHYAEHRAKLLKALDRLDHE